MRERPIPLKGCEVLALLDGRKTQTRRPINPQPNLTDYGGFSWKGNCYGRGSSKFETGQNLARLGCPYGQPGDRLWVREAWRCFGGREYEYQREQKAIVYRATSQLSDAVASHHWRPSILMPRWASRITLEITGVRVERVQEISEADARAEGVDWALPQFVTEEPDEDPRQVGYPSAGASFARDNYRRLWNSINAKRGFGWDTNPWVWAIEFRVETHRR